MDRFIGSSTVKADESVFDRSKRDLKTPYDHLLQSVVRDGKLTPKPARNRRTRILPQRALESRLNLSRKILEETREATMVDVSGWLRRTAELVKEPESISAFKIIHAPNLEDDYYLNLLDWSGSNNCIAVGLGRRLVCLDASTEASRIVAEQPDTDTIASVAWMPACKSLIAMGSKEGRLELFDVEGGRSVRRFQGHCKYRTGALAWNGHQENLLTSGGRDKLILHHDVRVREPVAVSRGHTQEVCGVKWDQSGTRLASGGNDNCVMVWDPRQPSSPIITYDKHLAAVKALAWSPHIPGLLTTGGGTADRTIRFWNTRSGSTSKDPIKTIAAGSQVCNMVWSKHTNELITTHGFSEHQIMRWSYPSLANTAVMLGHQQRILHLALSPDGQTIVTGSPDGTLRFWHPFGGGGPRAARFTNHGIPTNPFL